MKDCGTVEVNSDRGAWRLARCARVVLYAAVVGLLVMGAACGMVGCAPQGHDVWDPAEGPIFEAAELKGLQTRQDTPDLDFYSYILANSDDVTDDVIAEWYYATVGVDSRLWYMIEFADRSEVDAPGSDHHGVWGKYGTVYTGATFELIRHGDRYGFDEYRLVSYEHLLKPDGNGGLVQVE